MTKTKESSWGEIGASAIGAAVAAGGIMLSATVGNDAITAKAQAISAGTPCQVVIEGRPVNVLQQRERVMGWLQQNAPRRITVRWGEGEPEEMFASDLKAMLERLPDVKVYEAIARGKVASPRQQTAKR